MNLSKTSALLAFSLGSILPISANEYKFEEIKFDKTAISKIYMSQKTN